MVPLSQQDSNKVELGRDCPQSQRPDNIDDDEDLLQNKLELASREYWANGQSHFFYRAGFGSLHVRLFSHPQNKKLLIISPGRGESSLKYAEFIYDFKDKGFDFLVIDHRGQGFSERYSQCLAHGHVDCVEEYVDDLRFVIKHFKSKKRYNKNLLIGHSMGAAVAAQAQLDDGDLLQGMILCSPMLKLKTKGIPQLMASGILGWARIMRWHYKPLYRNLSDIRESFTANLRTSCSVRFHYHLLQEQRYPQIKMGAPTLGWLNESIKLTRRIEKRRRELSIPILLIQAQSDTLVCSKAQDRFAHEVENCRIIRLKDSGHEILSEREPIRARAFVQIEKFLKEIS